MNWNKLVFKTHKWLAVAAGLLAFIWFLSGVVMLLPSPLWKQASLDGIGAGRGPAQAARPAAPGFRNAQVSLAEAIAAAEAAAGRPLEVTGASFRRLAGRLVIVITTGNGGTHLVDAVSTDRLVVTEELAREIAAGLLPEGAVIREVTRLGRHDSEYVHGPLPAFRFAADNAAATIVYVGEQTGESRSTDRLGRWRAFLTGAHTLDFLRPHLPARAVRLIFLTFASLGTLMSVFGGWILWLQTLGWWRRRRGAA